MGNIGAGSQLISERHNEMENEYNKNRENKIRELQDKFDELIPQIIEPYHDKNKIPEIQESMDGEIKPTSTQSHAYEKWLIAAGLIIVASALAYFYLNAPIKTFGEMVPKTRIVLRAPFDGQLSEINYTEGQYVNKGSSFGRLQYQDLEKLSNKKQEEFNNVNRQHELVDRRVNRLKKMVARVQPMMEAGNISLLKYEEIYSNYELALLKKEELKQSQLVLQSDINYITKQIDQSMLIAPISGMVVTAGLEGKRDTFYLKGEKIAEIIDPQNMVIEVTVNEKYISQIKLGQKVRLKWSTSASWQDGKISKIGEFVGKPILRINDLVLENKNISKKGMIVQIELNKKDQSMKYGMDVKAKIYIK